ncbi:MULTISPECIES: methyl-accepting chemotaxis protein [Actinomadura]|uniref:Methyl-accepting chemotaxis protein n=1 Tax=Actinomadura yumaensis TaxID=111807 RepID=A0ABW2CKA1_9ACTN|nr:methyl-accepting chemotaxis protein [Actinomadura sp. J1-007]MWK37065.1 hypothetical protein [Actinomadura sp. J1-007]
MLKPDVGDELRALADHPDLAAKSALLRDLSEAMSDRTKAERWCEVDLFAAFAPAETVIPALPEKASRKHWASRAVKGLLAIGPVLVFLPVLFTWMGLHEATSAYGQVLDDQDVEAARRPFLEMWQQGFDGRLPSFFQFNNVAMLTVAAILFLGTWTVGENLLYNRSLDRAERRQTMLRARLSRALTETTLYLGQIRMSAPSRFTAELSQAAIQITAIGETVRKAQSDLMDAVVYALEAAQKTGDALLSSADEVQSTAKVLDRHFQEINSATATMTVTADSIATKTGQSVEEFRTGVTAALDDELQRLASGIRASVSELRHEVEELVSVSSGITKAIDRSTDSVQTVGSATERTVNTLVGQLTETLNLTAADFERAFSGASTEIRAALGDWADTAGTHASRIEIVTDVSGRTVDMLDRTRSSLERLATLPDQISQATGSALNENRATVTAELDELKRSIAEFSHVLTEAAQTIAPRSQRQGEVA